MNEKQPFGANHQQTLCWDCENATGGCSWADHNDHTPVEGWKAIPTTIRIHNPSSDEKATTSYIVLECPEFIRDATDGGRYRIGQEHKTNHRKEIDEQAIIMAYQCGVRIKEIEETTGHAESTIRRILDNAGIKKRDKRIRTSPGWAEAARRRIP